jgi:hypothetical protein
VFLVAVLGLHLVVPSNLFFRQDALQARVELGFELLLGFSLGRFALTAGLGLRPTAVNVFDQRSNLFRLSVGQVELGLTANNITATTASVLFLIDDSLLGPS